MPAARGVKRTASKASTATASTGPKNKKKRGAIQLEIPSAPKKRGSLFVCGQGDVGQLGLGEDVPETSKFKHVTKLGNKIVDACAGGMHTIALDSDGKVWTFGCNDEGALGRATSGDAEEGAPAAVALPARAVCIAAGDSHSAALLANGDVYAWGAFRDSHGSMGLVMSGREGKTCREPVKVAVGETAVAIASGGDHLVVLSSSGGVYTLGCGEQGQLGRLPPRSASRGTRQGFSALLTPAKLNLKSQAARIWAGYHATFILDAGDKMFACGLNNYSQLGITGEKRKTALFSPTECDAFTSCSGAGWRQVSCGQHHSLALDSRGQVYSIGRCEYGRLGLGERPGDAEQLEAVPALRPHACVSVAAGTSSSFAVTDAGAVFAWGMGSEGQLGTGDAADRPAPAVARVPAGLPSKAAAGGQHSVILALDPNQKEPTPEPAAETEDVPMEAPVEEEREKEKEKQKEKPQRKRQKKNEQEDEISSTSGASKLNGDDNKDAAMDVDEANKPESQDEEKMDTKESEKSSENADKPTGSSEKPTECEKPKKSSEKQVDVNEKKTEGNDKLKESNEKASENLDNTDTSSQDTTESETKDAEMKAEVNGTPEAKVVETKSVEIESSTPMTTSA